jgi:SAM-dependent methyltransferase
MDLEQLQRLHYDQIGSQYTSQYGDACSRQYREKFINEPLFAGIDLSGMNVLEAMCGSGHTTEYLLSRKANVTGLDISSVEIEIFKQTWPGCEARCASIFDSGLSDESFDCVAVVGGLHHLQPNIHIAINEIHKKLKPGGYFCFAEPHRGSFPDFVRSFWYKHDRIFAANEASVDLEALKREFSGFFSFKRETYLGNIAYLLVLNSMVFRIPVGFKPSYTQILMKSEAVINKLLGKRSSCYVVSQWQKA